MQKNKKKGEEKGQCINALWMHIHSPYGDSGATPKEWEGEANVKP